MNGTFAALVAAAALEIGGDAAIRRGLLQSAWGWWVAGAIMLVAYGFVVNLNRAIDFGQLMGVYIAVFFVVSQVVSMVLFAQPPSPSVIAGGALIVAGGLLIQAGVR